MKPGAPVEAEQDTVAGTPQGVLILAFLCGLVVAYLGYKSASQDFARLGKMRHLDGFVETPGKFIHVRVRRDSTGSGEEFYPDVLYEYFVDGKSIWGWRFSYEEEPKPKAFWEGRLAGYAQGASIPVFYDARFPKDSIVEKKHDDLTRVWLKMALGMGFLLAGLVLTVLPLSIWVRRLPVRK